ncbi:MAG: hypothetical protein RIT04_36 [Candidatus Parcubacteria bacterium]
MSVLAAFVIGCVVAYAVIRTGKWFIVTTTVPVANTNGVGAGVVGASDVNVTGDLSGMVGSGKIRTTEKKVQSKSLTNDYEEDPMSIIEQAKQGLPHSDTTALDAVSATAYVVTDVATNRIVMQRDASRALPIASITKLVTAVVERSLLDPDTSITITKTMLATEGATGGLRLGEKIKPEELLYPLLMVSSNDAAEAFAQASPVGRKKFIRAMNDWASSIGAYNTYFADPSGLSKLNVSSARDVALIMAWISKNAPDLLEITMTKVRSFYVHTWVNPTHFLNLSTYRGGKNGYTDEAGRTGVSLFEIKDAAGKKRQYIVVVLNSKNRDYDELSLLQQAATR